MQALRCSLMIGLSTLICVAQQTPAADQSQKMQIVLEQQVGKTSRVVNPQHVFKTGDLVRFRFRSSFNGYLHVTDRAASGKYLTLFPGEKAGTDNRLVRGKDYLIPATADSWFRIDEPAGYETVFFVVTPSSSPDRTGEHPPQAPYLTPPPAQPLPDDMMPRCDDAIFRARGECLDANAGASAVSPRELSPTYGTSNEPLTPREIVVIRKTDSSVVAPATDGDAPIIYQFRIAHR
jgi:hypothetical protein